MKKAIYLFIICVIGILTGCDEAGYRKSFDEIDELINDYPAQARLYLNRADSNENKAYYKLLATKIAVRQKFFSHTDYADIDASISDYEAQQDTDCLMRAYLCKAAIRLHGERDTAGAKALYQQIERLNGGRQNKTIAETYDQLCQAGEMGRYRQLRNVALAISDTMLFARSYLYQAIMTGQPAYADTAFALSDKKDNSMTRTMRHEYVRSLIESDAPDSIVMHYLPEISSGISPAAYVTVSQYLYNHPNPQFAREYLVKHGTTVMDFGRKTYWFSQSTYALMSNMYFVALHDGDKALADSLLQELKAMEYIFESSENYHKEMEVNLMYEGGNARYRFLQAKTYVMYGIIAILLLLLAFAWWHLRKIRRANRIITSLNASVHQLKDIDNPALSERCDALSHEISNQLRRLKHRDSDIAGYKQQVEHLENVSQGLIIYSRILQNQNISQIGRKGINQFLDSYRLIDEDYSQRLSLLDLNPSARLFCVLYHLGKTDDEVMQIMQYTLSNVRVRKSRIKADAEAESFDDLITK